VSVGGGPVTPSRRPWTAGQALAAAISPLASYPVLELVRARESVAAAASVALGLVAGTVSAWALARRARTHAVLSALGLVVGGAMLLASVHVGAAAVGVGTLVLVATYPSARWERAGGLCVLGALVLGTGRLLPSATGRAAALACAVFLLALHFWLSPRDWTGGGGRSSRLE
jgi:hypothetical protein